MVPIVRGAEEQGVFVCEEFMGEGVSCCEEEGRLCVKSDFDRPSLLAFKAWYDSSTPAPLEIEGENFRDVEVCPEAHVACLSLQTLDEFEENVFPLLFSGYHGSTRKKDVALFFSGIMDLLPHHEVIDAATPGAFIVNFLDFEDAMQFLEFYRSPFAWENKICVRPQNKTLLLMKLWSDLKLRHKTEFRADYVSKICRQLSQTELSKQAVKSLILSVQSLFTHRKNEAFPGDEGAEGEDIDVFATADNVNMKMLYDRNGFFLFSMEVEKQEDDIVAIFADFFRCILYFTYEKQWDMLNENEKVAVLADCVEAPTLECIQGLVLEAWSAGDFMRVFAGPVIRDAVYQISELYPMTVQKSRQINISIGNVLAGDGLVNRLRTRGRYCKVLINTDQNIFYAVKSVGFCLNIVNLNDKMTRRSFDLIASVFDTSKQIIQEFMAQYCVQKMPSMISRVKRAI